MQENKLEWAIFLGMGYPEPEPEGEPKNGLIRCLNLKLLAVN